MSSDATALIELLVILLVAASALRSERPMTLAEQGSAVALVLLAALFILAAVLVLKPVGVRIALEPV